MSRTPLIAGNWKMNTTVEEAVTLIKTMQSSLHKIQGIEKVLCPPFVALMAARAIVKGSSVKLGAQNVFYEEKGAYTGEISPLMLADLCDYVIIGHSERRQYFGETDEDVSKKIKTAVKVGLKPILCVGETAEENEADQAREVIGRQLIACSDRLYLMSGMVIAYEPIWAIGTGKSATGDDANRTIGFIRQFISRLHGSGIANTARILYGGSVTSGNISEYMRKPEIDGALVGGASLKADDFISIVKQASEIKGL
ncbi:MAG: triose-phosphate isomerase [Chloroflexi bacterium RBG_16_50_11]|nr:MAG: triose-phosphate isomerase [Chloroflexi bacterium RBG_16_50_11]